MKIKRDRIEIIIENINSEKYSVVINEYTTFWEEVKKEIVRIDSITLAETQHLVKEIYYLVKNIEKNKEEKNG